MSSTYHLWGIISSLLFLLTVFALYAQLKKIHVRKQQSELLEGPTDVISLNRTFFSYLAFYANYVLGMSLPHFDYYLTVTRTFAIFLLLLTLWEIFRDRLDRPSTGVFFISLALYFLATLLMFTQRDFLVSHPALAQNLVIIATLLLIQGYIHQMIVIRKARSVGGVSKLMFQLFTIKEISTIAFAFAMGLEKGWPLLLMHSTILLAEIAMLWHFRWVRLLED